MKTRHLSVESAGFILFLSLLVVTPLAETPKNILIVGLFIWWLATQNVVRDLHTTPLYMKCFLLFSILPLITLMTSDLTDAEELIFEIRGAIKFGIALLPVYSLSIMKNGQKKAIDWIVIILAAGGLIACIDSFILYVNTGRSDSGKMYMELRGVGHINQSVLYMVLVVISASMLIWSEKIGQFVLGWIALIISSAFIIMSRSLNAFFVLAYIIPIFIIMLVIARKYMLILNLFISLSVGVLVYASVFPHAASSWNSLKKEITTRFDGNVGLHYRPGPSSYRFHIYQTVLEIYDRHLWFGVGPDQFGKATSETELRAELDRENRDYDLEKHKFFHTTHGHNVWLNVLVERGMTGVLLVLAFFVLSGFRIVNLSTHVLSRSRKDVRLMQLLFLSSATWIMMFVGGIANTTLHLEHGMIGVMLLVWSLTSLERLTLHQGLK